MFQTWAIERDNDVPELIHFFKNPTTKEVRSIVTNSIYRKAKGFLDEDGDVYVWNDEHPLATHPAGARKLKKVISKWFWLNMLAGKITLNTGSEEMHNALITNPIIKSWVNQSNA